MDIRDASRDGFTAFVGHQPAGLWSAPGALTLAGVPGGDGPSLSFAINRRTVVALGLRDDRMLRVASSYADEVAEIDLALLSPERLHGWSAYPLGAAFALGEFGADLGAVPGVDLFIESDVPVGSGLASSTAIEVAVTLALNDVWRLGLSLEALAQACRRAEEMGGGAPADLAAPTASLNGRAGSAVLLDDTGIRHLDLGFEQAGLVALVIDTGAGRGLVPDLQQQAAEEDQRVLNLAQTLGASGVGAIGHLLDESHRSIRAGIGADDELDLAVDVALTNGATGARMLGYGGAALALVPDASVSLVQVALDGAFSEHGYSPPDTFAVVASSGATREP